MGDRIDGTQNVFEAARAAGVPRVVHVCLAAAEKFRACGMCVSVLRPKTFLVPGRMGLKGCRGKEFLRLQPCGRRLRAGAPHEDGADHRAGRQGEQTPEQRAGG